MKNYKQISLSHFKQIKFEKPSDLILKQIGNLISSGILKPGDRLPSERFLADRFGVGRGYIREAIRKLEFYGILKTYPQKGTFVVSLGVKALEGLISNVLNLDREDFISLMEVRGLLEINAARLAALRITDKEIEEMEQALSDFRKQVENNNAGLGEDLLFHLKIAKFSKNRVLNSLISLMSTDIFINSKDLNTSRDGRIRTTLKEHTAIFNAIKQRDPKRAAQEMKKHMRMSEYQVKYRKRLGRNKK